MPRNESLITAYLLDGQGSGKKIGWNEVEQWSPDQGILWIHLNYTMRRSVQWLTKKSGLDAISARALLTDESRPRSVITPKGILLFLRGVNLNPGQNPEDMVSIRIWINEHCIITTRQRKLLCIDDIQNAIKEGVGPKTPAEFLRMLNDHLLERISNAIDAIEENVDDLEQEVIKAESHLLRPQIADVRRQSILIRRYLAPQREALNKLYHEETSLLCPIDRMHLREANNRIIRYIEDLDAARERAAITQEELTSRLSEQMGSRMYILSVVAVVFLPLSFITGLLGINVAGIPGANYKWAFLLVCSGLSTIMLIMFWFFHKRKWI